VVRLVQALGERVEAVVLAAAPAEAPLDVLTPRSDWRIGDVLAVAETLRQARVDLVHVQYAPVSFRWRRAAHLLPRLVAQPAVVTMHEVDALPFDQALIRDARATIATTSHHAALLGAARHLRTVPIGPNVQPPRGDPRPRAAAARRAWKIPERAPLVVFFGFLHPVKGLEYLVRAFKEVQEAQRDARLVLAGGWESLALPGHEGAAYRDRLVQLRAELGLGEAVTITGYLPDGEISGLLFAADVVALPFTYGLSFKSGSLLAALAHGAPVLGTGAPGEGEAEGEGDQSEFVMRVPPRDVAGLAEALLDLLADSARRQRLAEAGQRAGQPFSWSAIAEAHLEVYASVLIG
jgi:glycosyltransferase involved in cell wall biosynthesis